ncbi:MAG: (d)CMP kinase [Rickettsiaceae bacterium]|nr:(d)CMP kinase [Rickettsiaceae bacterium]
MSFNIFLDKKSKLKIAVDGESGSGKGSICKRIANEYKLLYCETSIFYRKLAYIAISNNIFSVDGLIKIINSEDFSANVDKALLYDERVAEESSKVAVIKEVREAINQFQVKLMGENNRIIMEGRDIGTIIMPDADVKLYVKADIEVRAVRRYSQYKENGIKASVDQIKNLLIERDERDKAREHAPLKIASDAIIVDNSADGFDEIYNYVIELITQKCFRE